MSPTRWAAVMLITWFSTVSAVNYICPYKECMCEEDVISCGNLGLQAIPELVNPDASGNFILTFDRNNITKVPAASLPRGLKTIELTDNPITTINDSAFDEVSDTLERLDFSGCRFTRIPDAFLHLRALTGLSITHMKIQDWNFEAMKNIGQTVEELYLEDVGLAIWPDWIGYFSHLTELTITTSSISSLPDGAMHNMTNSLRGITLINSCLTSIPKAFSELLALQWLSSVNTKISDVTYLPPGSNLTTIDINNSSLTNASQISDALRPYGSSLSEISLQGNKLNAIPALSFLTNLGSIDLSQNLISDSNSGSIPSSAFSIDLGHNKLRTIPRMMSQVYSVTTLTLPWNNIILLNEEDFHMSVVDVNLAFNIITELTDTSFPQNASIINLNLNYNPIIRISSQAFHNLQHLTVLDMRNTKLTRIPLALASLRNNITTVPAGSLPWGLKTIVLTENPITTIDDSAFEGSIFTLERLDFSSSRFTRIPDAFLRIRALTDLSITHMSIQDWNLNAMKSIGQTVQNLYLEDVNLSMWPDWIGYFSHVTQLTITTSSISFLPDGALHNQTNTLTTLTLMNNSLKAVPKAFSELLALQMLNLVNTNISDLTYLPQGSKISSLALDNTSLTNATHISSMLRPYASSLINIYLQGNKLDAIPALSFLTSLGSIDLSHNLISDSNSGSMPSIAYTIDLGYNKLRTIPRIMSQLYSVTSLILPWNNIRLLNDEDFHTSVMDVDISFNLITDLTDTSFPRNASIMNLNLNYNPIMRISAQAFQNLQHLTDLNIRNTKLTRLPLAMGSLANLKSLDISGSISLVCTCMENALRPVMLGLDNLHGECGVSSISDFFLSLSLSCPSS